jgi:hypothetical protein
MGDTKLEVRFLTVDTSCGREIYDAVPRPVREEINALLKLVLRPVVVLTRDKVEKYTACAFTI